MLDKYILNITYFALCCRDYGKKAKQLRQVTDSDSLDASDEPPTKKCTTGIREISIEHGVRQYVFQRNLSNSLHL